MAEEKDLLKKIAGLEQQLGRANAYVHSIMEGLPFVAWLKDKEGRFIYVNEKYLHEFIKLNSVDDLLGKTDHDIFPKVEADKYKEEDDLIIKEKKSVSYNVQREDAVWFTTIKSPVIDEKGKVIGTTGIHRDITERVVNRSKYEFESNLLQALLDSIPDTIYFKDRDSRFIRVNRAKSEEVGFSNPDDMIGKSDADFFSVEETKPRIEDEQRIIKTGIPLINKIEHAVDSNGNDFWVSSTKCALRDKDGNITGLVGISRNVTETNRALMELEREKEFMQLLMDHIQHTIYFKDTECRFTKINKAQAKLIGLEKPEDAVGKTDFDFFQSEHSNAAFNDEKDIMRTGVPIIDKIERLTNSEGEVKWVSATKYPTRDIDGNVTGIVGMSVDVTDKMIYEEKLKEAKEKAEESDRLKTAFLSNMSHEIRTPMNGIIGFSNLLRDSNLTESEKNEFLNHINNCGNQLLSLIDDIIDISKIESGQVRIQIAETHVNTIFNELYTTFQANKNSEGKENIELIKKTTLPDEKSVIYTDPFRLRQVLSNLIGNGIKFTNEGSVEFGYTLLENGYLKFYIKDTGIGIQKDKQQIIFERFGQVMDSKNISTLTMTHKGTGLGLAISANLIRLLGGDLWVESDVGRGATFFLTLPYKPVENYKKEKVENIDISTIDISGKTILIAEDEETNFTYFKEMLRNNNAKILWVKNGLDAVYSVKVNPDIELVLMDCSMPGMDGFTATAEIKKIRPTLPVIAQTVFALVDEKQKSLQSGCDDCISKPILIQELFKIFKKYLLKK
jgi:two-component system, sensor histidine kinase and response regulator